MIVDVFPFDDELDMLECRFYQHKGLVDLFVAVEGDHTFTGEPKPYHLTEARRRGRFSDMPLEVITAEIAFPPPAGLGAKPYVNPLTELFWDRDAMQRDAVLPLLHSLPGQPTIICGDVDEILRPWAIAEHVGEPVGLLMDMLIYSAHWRLPGTWTGSVRGSWPEIPSMAYLRNNRWHFEPRVKAGWHLSWFGEPDDRVRKMRHFSHLELRDEVGDRVGEEFPAAHLHVDGKQELERHDGDVPDWVRDGRAPAAWTKEW